MRPHEVKADQIRFVDTQLRIAALQCVNAGLRDMTVLYNDFARSKRPYFIEATKPLKDFLKRTKRGNIDKYVVSLANRLSLDSAQQTQFCERSRFAMQMSAKMPNPAGLITLMPIVYQQPERTCSAVSSADLYN
ncbi:hypothetical protein [Kordiimonas aquimaris]|uniref:hypothetical protein n=1 Tax=Kordiimonas aquimaris TaxID=707591 RepID=UPI0021CE1570|nr:hypothetical protein [Kordiimonas aquimaris]